MPPSTVFSYWRRRSNASPVPPTSQPTPRVHGASSPPQLPLIADSAALTATFDEKFTTGESLDSRPLTNSMPDFDARKATVSISTIDAPLSSTATLTVEPSSSEDQSRPRSIAEERERELSALSSLAHHSHPSLAESTPDQTNNDPVKPTSPFRSSFGKGLLNPQAVDSQPKRSNSPGMAPSNHRRFRTSPDVSPGDRVSAAQREYRFEGPASRRPADREVQQVEAVPQKSGKTMLHLLNPMSLLAKRRAHQLAGLRAEDVNKGSRTLVPAIPDDYDPRIRGNIVHDFSAPRPRRNLSSAPVLLHEETNPTGASNSMQNGRARNELNAHAGDSRSTFTHLSEHGKKQNDHSPVFREHFEDDKRVLQVENKAYLQSSLLTDPSNRDRDPHAIPVFARKLPSSITDTTNHDRLADEQLKQSSHVDATSDDVTKREQESDTVEIGQQQQPSGLPKHFKSNASRFSFDMNGVGSSTQEKLLEEKHKEKEAARKAQARLDGELSDVDDDYDNDMFDDLDGFEEEIPGVNVDAHEDDEFKDFSGPGGIFDKSWLAPNLSPVIVSPVNSEMPNLQDDQPASPKQEKFDLSTNSLTQGVSIPSDGVPKSSMTFLRESKDLSGAPLQPIPDEDDLYFDDGDFGELDSQGVEEGFDESIFDDPTSHLYDRKQPLKPVAETQSEGEEPGLEEVSGDGLKHVPSMASENHQVVAPRRYGSIAGPVPNAEIGNPHSGVLSEHNLEAFHNALADAASQAVTNGRFGHTTSVSERSLGQESGTQTLDSQPGLVSDESRLSQAADLVSFAGVFDDFNYDDDDDLLYDDPIIAAANAEALENDDEGFYGQEFGFYAQAYGTGSELTHGGYFGPRGVEGISRSHSGRGKFREPSLTPITERSEWSTRNSIISVAAHGAAHSNQSVPSPGLAQLVDIGSLDDEMSLGALMKLRRDAWGGSNGSLRSSSGSPPPQQAFASNRGSFAFSDVSPTVYAVPPDFFGGTGAVDSPIKESDKGVYPLPQQRTDRPTTADGESQI